MKNKKNSQMMLRMLLVAGLLLLFIPLAHAALSDSFARVFVKIDTFFSAQQYKPYAKTIDFIFFTMFFMALYVQVIKYAFKENTKQVKFIAILLGIMSGFLLTAGGYSVQKLIPYIPWLLYFLLAAFFYRLFVGMEWPKSNGWKLFLSFLLAALLLWILGQWMFPNNNQYSSFFDGVGRVDLPSISAPGSGFTPPTSSSGQGNANVPAVIANECGFFCKVGNALSDLPWWAWLIPLLLLGGGFGLFRGWQKLRNGRVQSASEHQTSQNVPQNATIGDNTIGEIKTLKDLKEDIDRTIKKKKEVFGKISIILRKKKLKVNEYDIYHKLLINIHDPAWLLDTTKLNDETKKLVQDNQAIADIIKLEKELETDLIGLMELEESLMSANPSLMGVMKGEMKEGKIERWQQFIVEYFLGKMGSPMQMPLGQKSPLGSDNLSFVGSKNFPIVDLMYFTPIFRAVPPQFREALGRMSVALKKVYFPHDKSGIAVEVRKRIPYYYTLGKHDVKKNIRGEEKDLLEKDLKNLTTPEKVRDWIKKGKYDKWKFVAQKREEQLKPYFEQEMRWFGDPDDLKQSKDSLLYYLWMQVVYLEYVLKCLKFLEEHEIGDFVTKLQPLWATIISNGQQAERRLQRGGSGDKPGVILIKSSEQFVITTRLEQGKMPAKVVAWNANGMKKDKINDIFKTKRNWSAVIPSNAVSKTYERQLDLITFSAEELGITTAGEHTVMILASTNATDGHKTYTSEDLKEVIVKVLDTSYVPRTPTLPISEQKNVPIGRSVLEKYLYLEGTNDVQARLNDIQIKISEITKGKRFDKGDIALIDQKVEEIFKFILKRWKSPDREKYLAIVYEGFGAFLVEEKTMKKLSPLYSTFFFDAFRALRRGKYVEELKSAEGNVPTYKPVMLGELWQEWKEVAKKHKE